MAPATQDQIATQLVAQLRALDPSVSAEIGTPERKIIDTFAEQLAELQVDLNLVSGALDLDSKFGSDLDNFVGLFGFGRQGGAFATGFVTFGRPTAATFNITIATGTQVQGTDGNGNAVLFQTTQAVTLASGQTSVNAPIQALIAGSQGNIAANTITGFANVGSPVLGITTVNNTLPTGSGDDSESDAELKVRFRNTVFRNVAGTEDQFLALALATQFSTKANVVGPISRYQEYIQVPIVDDATTETSGTVTVDEPDGTVETFPIPPDGPGNGIAGQWTTTPSSNPFAQFIYTNVPYFVSNGGSGDGAVFYREGYDFTLNAPPLDVGDTYRAFHQADPEIPDPATTPFNPNVTFFNVYTGSDVTVIMPRPGDVVLLEYSYLSAESRNDLTRNVTNCVDVYVNGQNPVTADAVIPPPSASLNIFTANPTAMLYVQNYRRLGQPTVTPVAGHIFTALYWQPVIGLPAQIVVGTNTYLLGTHYWAVQDVTLLGSSVRARNGIEWNPTANGMTTGDPVGGPYTGATIVATGASSVTISGYTYDKNIVDLQASLENNKQVTTDALAHAATARYFKLDVTVVYSPGASLATTNLAIQSALTTFFAGQYFGSTIQLSDLLFTIRSVTGVQNVRWSNDTAFPADGDASALNRVTECDVNGTPLSGPVVFNTDFFLRDNQLPTLPSGAAANDTLAGLIIRPRAQNTFNIV